MLYMCGANIATQKIYLTNIEESTLLSAFFFLIKKEQCYLLSLINTNLLSLK